MEPHVVSVRRHPEITEEAIACFQAKWATEKSRTLYRDCITHCLGARGPLPQWYLVKQGEETLGCAGLIPNDFISRMDLWPWLCGLYIEEAYRGHGLPALLMEQARQDARAGGFTHLYLCTDHMGYYERHGFSYIGQGYHPWGEESRIYEAVL